MPDKNEHTRSVTSRRSFLSTTGGVLLAAGTVGAANVGAVSNSSGLKRVQTAFGSVSSPISQQTRESLRQKALEAYREDGGQNAKKARAVQASDDAPLVGFAIAYDNTGVPQYLTAKTADPEQVDAQQEQLEERANALSKEIQNTSITPAAVIQQDEPFWSQQMAILAGGGADNGAGSIDHDIEVYHLDNDGVSDGENIAIVQWMTRQPEAYTNLNGDTTHDWEKARNSPGTESNALIDYAPQNDVTGNGTKTKTYSARDVENSFSWEHDGDVTAESNTDSQDADEHLAEFYQTQAGDASDTEQELGCVSVVEVSQPSDGFYDIAKVDAVGSFYVSGGNVYDEEEITDSQTINLGFDYL